MTRLLYLCFLGLTACSVSVGALPQKEAAQSLALQGSLHTNSYQSALYWDLESFAGLDDFLRTSYDSKSYDWPNQGVVAIEFEDLDYAEFSQISGQVQIHRARDSENFMNISFSSCNGILATYERDGNAWRHVAVSQTLSGCHRAAISESGKKVFLRTPMLVDDWFMSLAPDVTNYEVSSDGQKLTLIDETGAPLGIFRKRDET